MKKLLAILMMLALVASMMVVSTSAADAKLYKTMEEAQDGDLLWIVDFTAKEIYDPKPNAFAETNCVFTIGDDGRSVTLTPAAGAADKGAAWWGDTIKGLNIDNNSQYTMTCKIKAFGNTGSNNSTGVYGFRYRKALEGEDVLTAGLGMYGNWNSMNTDGSDFQNRSALFRQGTNKSGYSNVIDTIEPDADGFITVQIEYDVKEMEYAASYMGKDGKWIEDEQSYFIFEEIDDVPDQLCFLFYGYYNTSQATVKDVKFFKGVNLTPAQLAAEAPAAAETTTAAPVTTAAPTTAAPTTTAAPAVTPSTADATTYIVLACAAAAMTMAVVLKKKEN